MKKQYKPNSTEIYIHSQVESLPKYKIGEKIFFFEQANDDRLYDVKILGGKITNIFRFSNCICYEIASRHCSIVEEFAYKTKAEARDVLVKKIEEEIDRLKKIIDGLT